MTQDTSPDVSSWSDSPIAGMSRIARVFAWAAGFLVLGALIALITFLNWDRGGWTDSDGQGVDASPVPWGGFITASIPSFVGSVFLMIGVIAKGIELGSSASRE